MKPIAAVAVCFALVAVMATAATPQEQALMSVWSAHAQTPSDHDAVLAACQKVMDKSSTLGEYLPLVKTIAAWHLLASGKEADAVRIFESALVADKQQPLSIAKFADIMARRWLTRMDIRKVDAALKTYYVSHVEYPASLAPIYAQPPPAAPAKTDRFGDAWNYRLADFSRLSKVKAQRYHLYSKNIGNGASRLKDVSIAEYSPRKSAVLLGRKTDRPVTVELEVKVDGETKRASVIENNIGNGVRLLKLSSDQRFAVLTDSECDYWIIAVRPR